MRIRVTMWIPAMGKAIPPIIALALALGAAMPSAASAVSGQSLQAALERVTAEHRLIPGAAAYVSAPREGLPWKGAAGRTALQGGDPLDPDDPFRLASTTKPFVAAAVIRLVEERRLSLDDSIARWLDAWIVDRVHVMDGVNYGRQITVRQLLNHTSGIYSHDEDPMFSAQVATEPRKRWTAEEEIEIAIRNGPYFKPGEGWHYSDTGFVMAGLIIERVTGQNLGVAVRDLLAFERQGMRSTWWELFETPPPGVRPRAHQYVSLYDFTDNDPSFDSYGGGGLVSTTEDLGRFMRALFDGRVFKHKASLAAMLRTVPTGARMEGSTSAYGLGIGRRAFDGTDCWGHPGFWSVLMYYCPDLDLVMTGTTNQASDEHRHDGEDQIASHTEKFLGEALVKAVKELPADERRAVRVSVRPRGTRTGKMTRFRLKTLAGAHRLAGARVRFAGRRVTSGSDGLGWMTVRFSHPGMRRVKACADGYSCGSVTVSVRRR